MPKHATQSESIGDQETKFHVTAAAYIGQTGLENPSRLRAETEVMCLLLDPGNFGGNGFRANGGPVLLRDIDRPTLFSPQIIPQQFDPDTAKSWLGYCAKHHRLLCETELESVHGLQVIDCTTFSIKSGGPGLAYVALSYVWEKSGGACGSIREEGGRKWLPEKLSAVIRDSIEVTKALGYRYLWVDKFCIDQNDPATKHDQIQHMDAIYQNSALTIISAAGIDETHGLPGVSGTARRRQLIIRAEGVTVIQALKDPQHSIASSHWSTRGWTFQEALLSRRRLVFTDDQMYFECNTMNCFESFYMPLDILHTKNKSKTYEFLRSGMFSRNRKQKFGKIVRGRLSLYNFFCRYLSNVEDYSARRLGYDEDSLNAFRGVLARFSKERHTFGHVWGIAYPDLSPRGICCFVYALAWSHAASLERPRRRSMFPSWTWIGWHGPVEYEFDDGRKLCFFIGIRGLRFGDQAGGPAVEFSELCPESRYTVLHITGPVIPFRHFAYHPTAINNQTWTMNKYPASLSWSRDGRSNAEIFQVLKNGSKWQCLYIGSHLKTSYVVILELRPDTTVWERAGIFCVEAWTWDIDDIAKGDQYLRTFAIM
ncbi:hypothetical protein PG997_014934 [Apiospora hydei]|uniref:Heterokaryon incompatibility domain-containing protein n=1 Tax=Apiospora hydei TaxID=1337664 RepID=A0ABR1UV94_9PEZI